MQGCRHLLIRSAAGVKQKLSRLRPFSVVTPTSSRPSTTGKRGRLPEFAMVGLFSTFAGVCGGAGYAAYANSRVDARRDGFIMLERDSELGEPLWILYKKKTKEQANHDDDEAKPKKRFSSLFSSPSPSPSPSPKQQQQQPQPPPSRETQKNAVNEDKKETVDALCVLFLLSLFILFILFFGLAVAAGADLAVC